MNPAPTTTTSAATSCWRAPRHEGRRKGVKPEAVAAVVRCHFRRAPYLAGGPVSPISGTAALERFFGGRVLDALVARDRRVGHLSGRDVQPVEEAGIGGQAAWMPWLASLTTYGIVVFVSA